MERRSLEVPPGHAGSAVARIVHDGLGVPHSTAKGLIDAGCVTINGRPVKGAGQRCEGGDVVEVRFDPHRHYHPLPEPRHGHGFRVVHEDAQIVVVDKMPGVLSTPAPGDGDESLAERIAGSLRQRGIKRPQVFVVHRLDRHTSGLLVFAKTPRALESLSAQFESREAGRVYTALVAGRMEKDRGTIVSWLAEDPRSLSVRTTSLRGAGKRAITHFEVLERFADSSLVRVRLETGRKHQIRVHLAEIGHPVLGDRRYGEASKAIQRVALHAERLTFRHPTMLETVSYEAPCPEDLKSLLDHLRREGTRRVSEEVGGSSGSGVAIRGEAPAAAERGGAGRVVPFPQGLVLLDAAGDPTRTKGVAGAPAASKGPREVAPWSKRGARRESGKPPAARDSAREARRERSSRVAGGKTAPDSARPPAARIAPRDRAWRPAPGAGSAGSPAAHDASRDRARWPIRDADGEPGRRSKPDRRPRGDLDRDSIRREAGGGSYPRSKPHLGPAGGPAPDRWRRDAGADAPGREIDRRSFSGAKGMVDDRRPWRDERGRSGAAGGKPAATGDEARRARLAHARAVGFKPKFDRRGPAGRGGNRGGAAEGGAGRGEEPAARHGRAARVGEKRSWDHGAAAGAQRGEKAEVRHGDSGPETGAGRSPGGGGGAAGPPRVRKPWEFKQKGMTLRRERRRLIASSKRKDKRNR